jgi:hypothetical protein
MKDRFRRCLVCGDYHWTSEWPDNHREPVPERSALPAPYFISDTMDALFHPVTNQMIDSKRQFSAITKASGQIELGTEVQEDRRHYDIIQPSEVALAKQMVDQGYSPKAANATVEETQNVIA